VTAGFDAADAAVAAIAERQHALVTTAQLDAAGIRDQALARRVRRRTLRRYHRGVYLFGLFETPRTREMGALLACGPEAVLSHRSAAHAWGLPVTRPDRVDVLRPTHSKRPGIHVHRGVPGPGEVLDLDGLRVTSPPRTLLDLAPSAAGRELERLVEEAQVLRLATRREIEAVATTGHTGVRALLAALAAFDTPAMTRSEAERALRELLRSAGLPVPAFNARVAGHEVDLHWPAQRLVGEMDGWRFHSSRAAFERDRARDQDLVALGYRVIRITWRQIVHEPQRLLARIAAALAVGVVAA
jgi:very-short-patch-repair endonuclease